MLKVLVDLIQGKILNKINIDLNKLILFTLPFSRLRDQFVMSNIGMYTG